MVQSLENGLPHANNLRVRILFSKPKLHIYPRAEILIKKITQNSEVVRKDYKDIISFAIECYLAEQSERGFRRIKEKLLGKRYLPYEKIKLVEFYYQWIKPELDDENQDKVEWKTSTTNSLWLIYNGMRK